MEKSVALPKFVILSAFLALLLDFLLALILSMLLGDVKNKT